MQGDAQGGSAERLEAPEGRCADIARSGEPLVATLRRPHGMRRKRLNSVPLQANGTPATVDDPIVSLDLVVRGLEKGRKGGRREP